MTKSWWKECVVYQIYPRSFMDSNGDGIGDINGITKKLDYLKLLGVDVLWVSPIYESPNDDNGYDISNYKAIMKEFGTMEDFDLLLSEAHKRGLKIMMDLVVNHTSDEHTWFIESRKSRDNKYRDYYIWRDGNNGHVPNNWGSNFGGSVWEYDKVTDMYYLHLFSKKQPDLNWENQKLRNEIYEMMEWWVSKGIDGFRMDVINMISKNQAFPEGVKYGESEFGSPGNNTMNGPRIHEFLKEMNKEVLSKYDLMTVGETPGVTTADALLYAGEHSQELNMVFQFEHMGIGDGADGKWGTTNFDLLEFKRIMSKWQTELEGKAWNSLYLNNHDQPRMVSRFGNDSDYRVESAKMLATCIHMMKGTPYIYQGEEIGMTNVKFADLSDYRDIETLNAYHDYVDSGKKNHQEFMEAVYKRGRDNARTPFQWDESENAGFTDGTPWIKVNPNYISINAQAQINDNNSVFNYYRRLIELRKEHEVIVYGAYSLLDEADKQVYSYTRELDGKKLFVICNFCSDVVEYKITGMPGYNNKKLLISNYKVEDCALEAIDLKPYEARVYLYENID